MNLEELVKYILEYCKKNNKNKIYICGKGTSGKTTLSKKIFEFASCNGKVNIISTDDFLAESKLRNDSCITLKDEEKEVTGRYTTSIKESYFFKNIYEILYNIDNGLDCYYFPRRYLEKNNIRKMYSNYYLTVIEGIGTAFMDINKNESLMVFLTCSDDLERKRRIDRTKKLNRDESELFDEVRTFQFKINIASKMSDFDMVIESDEFFNYTIK